MIAKVILIQCDWCRVQAWFDTTDNSVAMLRAMNEGWHLTGDHHHLCKECADDLLHPEERQETT